MNIDRHKVFISYYHNEDQSYKDVLVNMKYYNSEKLRSESIFDDYSVRNGDIDDSGLTSEQIRRIIRDEYIQNATVLILLCGRNSKNRKHIDWEIHAAMYDSPINPKMGIIVINLPSINQYIKASNDSEKVIISNNPLQSWFSLSSRSEFEGAFPYMPSRIIDNLVIQNPITVVEWNTISNSPEKLMRLIDNAFARKDNIIYDHSSPLRRNNS